MVPSYTTILGVIFVNSSLLLIAIEKWRDEREVPVPEGNDSLQKEHEYENEDEDALLKVLELSETNFDENESPETNSN